MSKALTKEELVSINPDKIYNIKTYVMNLELWANITTKTKTILSAVKPKVIPFDDKIQGKLSNTAKGIYIFVVKPELGIDPEPLHLMYVGKVEASNTFHKRFYDYVGAIGKKDKRRNIQLLTNLWPGKTYVYVYELGVSDAEIVEIEDNLIDTIVPPMNNRFKLKRAKDSRPLYN